MTLQAHSGAPGAPHAPKAHPGPPGALAPAGRWTAVVLGVLSLASLVPLVAWDLAPRAFPDRAHDLLGAVPLAVIAFAYLAHRVRRHVAAGALVQAAVVALAFLFWAANQACPDPRLATVFNDIAIVGFVLDLAWVVVRGL